MGDGADAVRQGGMIAQTLLVTPHLPFKVKHAVLAATSACVRSLRI